MHIVFVAIANGKMTLKQVAGSSEEERLPSYHWRLVCACSSASSKATGPGSSEAQLWTGYPRNSACGQLYGHGLPRGWMILPTGQQLHEAQPASRGSRYVRTSGVYLATPFQSPESISWSLNQGLPVLLRRADARQSHRTAGASWGSAGMRPVPVRRTCTPWYISGARLLQMTWAWRGKWHCSLPYDPLTATWMRG